jgi:hypothetical protein
MVVFLLTLMPLTYWGIQYLFDQDNVHMSDRIRPLFYGLVAAIPVILLAWALDVYFPLNWNPLGIYVFTFFNKEGIIVYPIMFILFFIFRNKSYVGIPLRELTAWFCGFYFLFAFSEALILREAVSPYIAVIVPLMRVFTIFILTTLLVRSLHAYSSRAKLIYTILFFAVPFIINFIPVLYVSNRDFLFYLSFISFGILSMVLFFMESRGDLL